MQPVPMPEVRYAYLHPEDCAVALSLNQSPFGFSQTTPTIYVSRRERAPLGRGGLNRQVDVLVERLIAARQIVGVVITGAEDGNTITLNLGGDPTNAPTTSLLERLVTLTNWLNANAGSSEITASVARRKADLTDLDRPDRLPYNRATDLVQGEVRTDLVAAFNRALQAIAVDPEAVPPTNPWDDPEVHASDEEEA